MVRIASYVPLLLSFVAVALSAPAKRTVDEVHAAVADVSSHTITLNQVVNAFPASGAAGALVSD